MLNFPPTLFENHYALCVASFILVLFFVDVLMQSLYNSLPLRHLIRQLTFYHHKQQKFVSPKGDIEDIQARPLRRSKKTTQLSTLASRKQTMTMMRQAGSSFRRTKTTTQLTTLGSTDQPKICMGRSKPMDQLSIQVEYEPAYDFLRQGIFSPMKRSAACEDLRRLGSNPFAQRQARRKRINSHRQKMIAKVRCEENGFTVTKPKPFAERAVQFQFFWAKREPHVTTQLYYDINI